MRKLKVMALYAHPADPITDCAGAFGRVAGVPFAEAYCRAWKETRTLLPVTEHALGYDFIMNHEDYSHMSIREKFPYDAEYFDKEYKK